MESIGEKLRLAREKNNYTIEQVSRDTHVARRFLKALEDEDFSVFPGETYAMGFLRNYAEYLGLNAEEFVGLYRNLKIQEQPLPMTELLQSRPRLNRRVLVVFIVAALIIVVGGGTAYLIHRSLTQGQSRTGGQTPNAAGGTSQDFVFQEEVRTKWFKQGDRILVPLGDKNYRIEIGTVGDTVTLRVPGGTVELTLGKERFIDLDSDSKPDLKVVWNDVDRTSSDKQASLGLYRVSGSAQDTGAQQPAQGGEPAAGPAGTQPLGPGAGGQSGTQTPAGATPAGQAPAAASPRTQAGGTQPAAATPTGQTPAAAAPKPQASVPAGGQTGGAPAPVAAQPAAATVPKPQTGGTQPSNTIAATGLTPAATAPAAQQPAGQARAASTQASSTQPARPTGDKILTVMRAPEAGAIITDMVFRDYCLFRFLVDANEREERFFQKGESFSLDGKNQITLWLSNAGAVKAKISGKDVDLGNLGEVAAWRIAWRKDAMIGDYVLEVTPIN
jgi:cytoskeletal protein RodZ